MRDPYALRRSRSACLAGFTPAADTYTYTLALGASNGVELTEAS